MTQVSKFAFGGDGFQTDRHEVRVITLDGLPWFAAPDVCRALGLSLECGGAVRHLRQVAADERRVVTRSDSLSLFEGVRAQKRPRHPRPVRG